jgi:hypothetical protein
MTRNSICDAGEVRNGRRPTAALHLKRVRRIERGEPCPLKLGHHDSLHHVPGNGPTFQSTAEASARAKQKRKKGFAPAHGIDYARVQAWGAGCEQRRKRIAAAELRVCSGRGLQRRFVAILHTIFLLDVRWRRKRHRLSGHRCYRRFERSWLQKRRERGRGGGAAAGQGQARKGYIRRREFPEFATLDAV